MKKESPEQRAQYLALVNEKLGIQLKEWEQDGLGEHPDPQQLERFCRFYLDHPEIHPIRRAESVDQILGSLSMRFESNSVTDPDLELVRQVVKDASDNVWAANFLLAESDAYDPAVDPGDCAVNNWLLTESGLDMDKLKAQQARFRDPADNLE